MPTFVFEIADRPASVVGSRSVLATLEARTTAGITDQQVARLISDLTSAMHTLSASIATDTELVGLWTTGSDLSPGLALRLSKP